LSKDDYMKNHAKSPISQLLEISPHSNYLQIKKIQMKSQLPSFSHTICDPTIHVCVCVCVSLSLSLTCIVSLGNTKSKFLFVVAQELHNLVYSRGRPTTIKVFILQPHQPPRKKAIVETRKCLGYFFLKFNTRKSLIYKVKLRSEEIGGSFGFSLAISSSSSSFHQACSISFVGTSLGNFIGWPARALCYVGWLPWRWFPNLGVVISGTPGSIGVTPHKNKIRAA
jgi:hypothetical protein